MREVNWFPCFISTLVLFFAVSLVFTGFLLGRENAFQEVALEKKMETSFVDIYRQNFRVQPCEHENMPSRERCTEIRKAFMDGQSFNPSYAHAEEIAAYARIGAETRQLLQKR